MRVAVTGSSGMLGHAIHNIFRDIEIISLPHKVLDITHLDRVMNVIREIKPDYLIHAAAFTDVDGCELDYEKAYLVNGIGTRNVVMACEEINCPIIYISTDYIFDGQKTEPYNEWDKPDPINKYGLSKLLGENFVMSLTNRFYIVRTAWLYGKNGKNFVDTIRKLLSERKELDVVDDQVGDPTYTNDLAKKIKELLGKGYGIYHITNASQCSWYEFAIEIARQKGVDINIRPVTSDYIDRPAKRPAFSVLGNTMLRLEGIGGLRHWKDALKEYLSLA